MKFDQNQCVDGVFEPIGKYVMNIFSTSLFHIASTHIYFIQPWIAASIRARYEFMECRVLCSFFFFFLLISG